MSHQNNYDKAKQELDKLAVCFDNTVSQAVIFQRALERVTDGNEADSLIIEMGKILDNHQRKMMEI